MKVPPGLSYSSDSDPGLTRKGAGRGFAFYYPDGTLLQDAREKDRLKALAVPPAYRDVWYCLKPEGHLQATGRDDRGRKQYRYHPEWTAWRDEQKFSNLIDFGEALPKLRSQLKTRLSRDGLHKERVVAAVVKLLDETAARIGNEAYLKENGTRGLTTLKESDVSVKGGQLLLSYRAKGGERREFDIDDPTLLKIVQHLEDLPGQRLFNYESDGEIHSVTSSDVNEWLREHADAEITAKDFRTWRASQLTLSTLCKMPKVDTKKELLAQETEALKQTSKALGHRPPVCRKHYVHPQILEDHQAGMLAKWSQHQVSGRGGLRKNELVFIDFLKERCA